MRRLPAIRFTVHLVTCSAVRALIVRAFSIRTVHRRRFQIARAPGFAIRAGTITQIDFASSAGEMWQAGTQYIFEGNFARAYSRKNKYVYTYSSSSNVVLPDKLLTAVFTKVFTLVPVASFTAVSGMTMTYRSRLS